MSEREHEQGAGVILVEAKGKEELALISSMSWRTEQGGQEHPEMLPLEVGELSDALSGSMMPIGRGEFIPSPASLKVNK